MVVIRLSRGGAKKKPFYHIKVADKRRARNGKFIECIGHFNPIARGQAVPLVFDIERAEYWISKGAQVSDRVKSLMKLYKKTLSVANHKAEEKSINSA